MKALAIVTLVFSSISMFVPVAGVFLAMACSLMALIAFRSQTTLAGIALGINIISTAFLSPSIVVSDSLSSDITTTSLQQPTDSGDIYLFYVGFHVVVFIIAVLWRLIRGAVPVRVESNVSQA